MIRAFLRSKIHRAAVTKVDIDYEGSLSLDEELMTAGGLWPNERVDVWNVSNGERFSTYVIRAEKGSREVGVFGAAGRKVKPGDIVIIAAYAYLEDSEVEFFTPRIVLVGEGNRVAEVKEAAPGARNSGGATRPAPALSRRLSGGRRNRR